MTIYDDMQKLASTLLTKFKQGTITLVKLAPGAGPITDPGPGTETVYPLQGAVARGVSFKFVQKGLAEATDLQVTTDVRAGVPEGGSGDFITIDGERFKIVQLVKKPAAGVTVARTYIVRK